MEAILIPATVAVAVFLGFWVLFSQHISSDESRRKKAVLGDLAEDAQRNLKVGGETLNILRDSTMTLPSTGAYGMLARLPGVRSTFELLLKAGLGQKRGTFLMAIYGLFLLLVILLHDAGILAVVLAGLICYIAPRMYLKRRIAKRNALFLNQFPDAIDMIIRSVRSGHPLNTAMRMISDNMENPIKEEFKQVIDEVSYGRSLSEALGRMARRIDEQDLHFFVVVLSVQQETGGSLAEVLTNLSGIIRKRRQLRMKILALTSEGRATAWVLGSLPVIEFLLLKFLMPDYMEPLFRTTSGNIILGSALGLIITAMLVVRAMINIDI